VEDFEKLAKSDLLAEILHGECLIFHVKESIIMAIMHDTSKRMNPPSQPNIITELVKYMKKWYIS
jgi:hypothetical protein